MRPQALATGPASARPLPGRPHLRLLVAGALIGFLPPFVANRLRSAALRAAGLQIGRGSIFWGMPTIIGDDIERDLMIGEQCGFNVGPAAQRAGVPLRAPVVIEDGAWVGARCTIMPGVTIGAGAVVGASMMISKDVPANTLLLGPQKISLAKWRA
jgi:maltose O-acetyltransferase